MEGSKKSLNLFPPLIETKDKALLGKTDVNFKRVEGILAKIQNPERFQAVRQTGREDRKTLQAPINALAEDLAKLRGILGFKIR